MSSLLLYLYASVDTLLTLECLAYFRAITRGVIGGLAKAYACLGWGIPVILLGLTWFLYGNDIGTDPECFIGWEAQTKLPNFAYSFTCSAVSTYVNTVGVTSSGSLHVKWISKYILSLSFLN